MTNPSAASSGTFQLGELEVHRLGYGSMRLTGDGSFGPPADRAEALRVLRRALDLDVNLIDTAESYGPHVVEELIAEALHPYPAHLLIATKGGFDRPGPGEWKINGRPERLREELDGSLLRLRLDRIDLWQLHRVDPEVPEDEQFGAVAEFVREGKVRYVGLSEVDVGQIERARRELPIVSVQNRYNLADRKWEAELDYCDQEGLAFMPWAPLKVGRLADAGPLPEIARRKGATTGQVALAWLLRRAGVMLPIPGTSKVRHLEENVAAAAVTLDDAEFEALDALSPPADR